MCIINLIFGYCDFKKQKDLIEKCGMLQTEMKSQKTEINQLKSEIKEFKSGNVELKSENEELKDQLSLQGQKILLLEKEISKRKSLFGPSNSCSKKVDNAASNKGEKISPRALLASLPTSCDGLRREGHFVDGIYLVLNEETSKIEEQIKVRSKINLYYKT